MTANLTNPPHPSASLLDAAIQRVCARIAPSWPLDRFIAVNPLWPLIERPLPEVAGELRALSGAQLLMPRGWYRQAYLDGRLRDEHLQAAIEQSDASVSLEQLRALLEQAEEPVPRRASMLDVVDAERDLIHEISWRAFVTHHVSQYCAAYFDEGQAQLGPERADGLYTGWREYVQSDRSARVLMGSPSHRLDFRALPGSARELAHAAIAALHVPPREQESYLWSLLLDQNGWASWCAYRRWTARLTGGDDDAIRDLLAIRLAWEWMLHRAGGDGVAQGWTVAKANWPRIDAAAAAARAQDWLLQQALEIAWRAPLLRALPAGLGRPRPAQPALQAVFCIDVRSEVFRRALEASAAGAQTLGFAGFFGMPIDYQPLAAASARPQLPGLLAPRLRATETGLGPNAQARRVSQLQRAAGWKSFQKDPLSTFTFVEALGVTYAGKLLADSLQLGKPRKLESAGLSAWDAAGRKLRLVGPAGNTQLELEARVELAAGMLRGMSLTQGLARLVVLVGHGSSTRNNPHAAGLDCGACCGQTGEVNARVAAALLNDGFVRAGLAQHGIRVPRDTWFLAALHDTTTDEVTLFDLDEVPTSHYDAVASARSGLAAAGERARAERAPRLGLTQGTPRALVRAVRARAADWAQVRAEWGLANNAAFIVAPREHCQHLNLEGRCFLHEYRHDEDPDHRILESIMTAPLVVTHWINFQYYASTVDNQRYGSGNKLLHNVVGGHLGVFEGNGGDLRIGLPMQSLHDGTRWVHEPLRLSVFIEAPRAALDRVLDRHSHVRALVTQGWVSLFQLDTEERAVHALRGGRWIRETTPDSVASADAASAAG